MILEDWPTKIRAGDTFQLRVKAESYTPLLDTLTIYLSSQIENYFFAATEDGEYFLFTVSATATSNWQAGTYSFTAVITTAGGIVETIKDYTVEILPNLRFGNADPRTHVKKTLDAIIAVLEKRATTDVQEYEIDNRRLVRMSVSELIKFKSHYERLYALERGQPTSIIRRFR